MGPFKHTVDDGLDIRKVDMNLIYIYIQAFAFETMVGNFEHFFCLVLLGGVRMYVHVVGDVFR